MSTVRWGALLLALVCLAVVAQTRLYDGVWLLGVVAALVFLGTFGVFTRAFWVRGGRDA